MVYVTNEVYPYYVLFYKTEVQIQCQKEFPVVLMSRGGQKVLTMQEIMQKKPCTIFNIVHKSRCNLRSDIDGKLKRCKRSSYRSSHDLAQIRSANF